MGAVFTEFWQPFSVGSLSTYRPWLFLLSLAAGQRLRPCTSQSASRRMWLCYADARRTLRNPAGRLATRPASPALHPRTWQPAPYHIPLSQRATAPNRLRKLQPHSAGSFRGAGSRTLIRLVREGPGFSVVARLGFSAALPGVALVPVTPGIGGELRLALQDQKHAPPALRAFPHSVGASKKQRR